MASAASMHRSSRNRRPVINTPIGNPVPSSRPAGRTRKAAQVICGDHRAHQLFARSRQRIRRLRSVPLTLSLPSIKVPR